jgi:hypothetical protein
MGGVVMGGKHTITMKVTVYMEYMDGSPELSAEIADEQVAAALAGRESQYGFPGEYDVEVTAYWAEPEPENDLYHGYDTTRDYELDNPPEPPEEED